MLERAQLDDLLGRLEGTCLGAHLVLVGSAAMYLSPTSIPPMTGDADVAVAVGTLANHLSGFLDDLKHQGFEQIEDTATFAHASGPTFDLLALDEIGRGDHVVRLGGMGLLAFEDLSRLVARPRMVREVGGVRVLAPSALVLSKLRTWRVAKGMRDKVQALAMIGDMAGDEAFLAELRMLVEELSQEDWEDVFADAQVAFTGLETDEARDYAAFAELIGRGFSILQSLRESP